MWSMIPCVLLRLHILYCAVVYNTYSCGFPQRISSRLYIRSGLNPDLIPGPVDPDPGRPNNPPQPKQNEEIACLMRLSFAGYQFISLTVHFLHFCHRKPWSTSGSGFSKAWIWIQIQRNWIRNSALHQRIHYPYLTYKEGILCNFSLKQLYELAI
jgi:hypothetical protein